MSTGLPGIQVIVTSSASGSLAYNNSFIVDCAMEILFPVWPVSSAEAISYDHTLYVHPTAYVKSVASDLIMFRPVMTFLCKLNEVGVFVATCCT